MTLTCEGTMENEPDIHELRHQKDLLEQSKNKKLLYTKVCSMSEQFKILLQMIFTIAALGWFFAYTLPFGEMIGEGKAIKSYADMDFECKTELVLKK